MTPASSLLLRPPAPHAAARSPDGVVAGLAGWVPAWVAARVAASLAVWIVACASGPAVPADCSRLAGLERDGCLLATVQASTAPTAVLALAPTIQDPLVRDAAVIQWVTDHRRGLARADGQALCALLSQRERGACNRRLDAPHLSR